MAQSGNQFFMMSGGGLKTWDVSYAPVPSNYTLLPPGQVPIDISFDLVFCQNRPAHFEFLQKLAHTHRVPLLCLEHILPQPSWSTAVRRRLSSMKGDLNVFVSAYGQKEWGFDDSNSLVVENGIDTELFSPKDFHRQDVCLSVVNDWINRDRECGFKFWVEATQGLPTKVLGKTPGLSEPAASLDDLAFAYQTSSIFLNTAQISPIPTVLLEAMACGCCVISTRNPMLESIIEHGVNGFFIDTPAEMKEHAVILLANSGFAREIGSRARKTVLQRFGMERFVEDWKRVFHQASNIILET